MFSEGDFDLVLMDYHLPVVDGPEATRRIRKIESLDDRTWTPILATTAGGSDDQLADCLDAGMDGLIIKPFSLGAIATLMEEHLLASGKAFSPVPVAQLGQSSPVNEDVATFDEGAFRQILQASGSSEVLDEVLDMFYETTPKLVSRIHEAVARDDLEEVAAIAHRLRGSCSTLGGLAMARLCAELESHARAGQRKETTIRVAALDPHHSAFCAFLHRQTALLEVAP